jgi:hypothetical protein
MKQRQIDDEAPEEASEEPRAPMRTGIRLSSYPEPEPDMPERDAKPAARPPRDGRRARSRADRR